MCSSKIDLTVSRGPHEKLEILLRHGFGLTPLVTNRTGKQTILFHLRGHKGRTYPELNWDEKGCGAIEPTLDKAIEEAWKDWIRDD